MAWIDWDEQNHPMNPDAGKALWGIALGVFLSVGLLVIGVYGAVWILERITR